LEDLCKSLSIDRNELEKLLSTINYHYTGDTNRFTPIL
jgi:hypothetical protein